MKDSRVGNRRSSGQTSRYTPHGWQAPRRTSQPVRRLDTFALPLANHLDRLPEVKPASQVYLEIVGEPTTSPWRTPRSRRPRPYLAETEHAGRVRVQPHGDSYFLTGKVAGTPVTFLLDSRCTTNFLSHCVFDALLTKKTGR